MIGIVDYDIGNLRSVQKAFQHVGGEAVFVRTPEEIAKVDALVLPGVGAFGDCVRSLRASGMWDKRRRLGQLGEAVFSAFASASRCSSNRARKRRGKKASASSPARYENSPRSTA